MTSWGVQDYTWYAKARHVAVNPAVTSPSPWQFVHITLQLACDRCLFPYTDVYPLLVFANVWKYTSDIIQICSHFICCPLSMLELVCACLWALEGKNSHVTTYGWGSLLIWQFIISLYEYVWFSCFDMKQSLSWLWLLHLNSQNSCLLSVYNR